MHGDVKTTPDVSFPTLKETDYEEVQTVPVSDVGGENKSCDSNTNNNLPLTLIHRDSKTRVVINSCYLNGTTFFSSISSFSIFKTLSAHCSRDCLV
jgi:hypothetical protein